MNGGLLSDIHKKQVKFSYAHKMGQIRIRYFKTYVSLAMKNFYKNSSVRYSNTSYSFSLSRNNGVKDAKYLSKVFHDATGMTPRQYRELHR